MQQWPWCSGLFCSLSVRVPLCSTVCFCIDSQDWLYTGTLKATDTQVPFRTFWFKWSRVRWDFKNSQRESKVQLSLITMALVTPSCFWIWFSLSLSFTVTHSPLIHQLLFLCYHCFILIYFCVFHNQNSQMSDQIQSAIAKVSRDRTKGIAKELLTIFSEDCCRYGRHPESVDSCLGPIFTYFMMQGGFLTMLACRTIFGCVLWMKGYFLIE